jgi:two-component sensor histidine kinase
MAGNYLLTYCHIAISFPNEETLVLSVGITSFVLLLLFFILRKRSPIWTRMAEIRRLKLEYINNRLERMKSEKETLWYDNELLKSEFNSRVKSNLDIILRLLAAQSASVKEEAAMDALGLSKSRIKTMFLIHEKIRFSADKELVDVTGFIRDNITYLRSFLQTPPQFNIEFNMEPLELALVKAEPLGMLLNEIITNSLKHAYIGADQGLLRITLRLYPQNILIIISDNGVGLTDGFDIMESPTLGIRLILGLTGQLDAKTEFNADNGLSVKIEIPLEMEDSDNRS